MMREPDPARSARAQVLQRAVKAKKEAQKLINGRFKRAKLDELPIASTEKQEESHPQRKQRLAAAGSSRDQCELAAEQNYSLLVKQAAKV